MKIRELGPGEAGRGDQKEDDRGEESELSGLPEPIGNRGGVGTEGDAAFGAWSGLRIIEPEEIKLALTAVRVWGDELSSDSDAEEKDAHQCGCDGVNQQ